MSDRPAWADSRGLRRGTEWETDEDRAYFRQQDEERKKREESPPEWTKNRGMRKGTMWETDEDKAYFKGLAQRKSLEKAMEE